MSFFKLLSIFAVSALVAVSGCKLETTVSFQDSWHYLAKPKKVGGSMEGFKTKL